jgi:hypothetical protein
MNFELGEQEGVLRGSPLYTNIHQQKIQNIEKMRTLSIIETRDALHATLLSYEHYYWHIFPIRQ